MRTKALFVAAFLAAGLASSMAQNVYSLNVVGYYNVTVPANGFAMVANQLSTTNNTLKGVIPTAPDGCKFYKYNAGWTTFTYDELEPGWTPNGDVAFAPGEGGMFRNTTASPLTLTFVGEVMQGSLTNNLPAGYAVVSSKVPQAQTLADMGLPGVDGDKAYVYNSGYTTFTYDELEPGWTPGATAGPTIPVGQAFFVRKGAPASWVRNFTVPQ
jgi:hypothetical protein